MAAEQVRHACVVDDEGKVIGIVSDRDMRWVMGDPSRAQEVERDSERLRALRVEWVMNRNPLTIQQDEPFINALPILVNGRVGAMPVVDDHGRLRGMLSYVDLLKAMAMYIP
jgi:acetoin utilization protein AcuB